MGPVFWAWCAIISACTIGLVDTLTPVTLGVETVAPALQSGFPRSPAATPGCSWWNNPVVSGSSSQPGPGHTLPRHHTEGARRRRAGLLSVAFIRRTPPMASSSCTSPTVGRHPGRALPGVRHADVADGTSAKLIIIVPHPDFGNHNGGLLRFGLDGCCTWNGDGGSGGDPSGNGQNRNTLLESSFDSTWMAVIRTRSLRTTPSWEWTGRDLGLWSQESVALCVRPNDGLLYIADVGQNAWKEVHVAVASEPGYQLRLENHGRAPLLRSRTVAAGPHASLVEYNHSDGCSITGVRVPGSRFPRSWGITSTVITAAAG